MWNSLKSQLGIGWWWPDHTSVCLIWDFNTFSHSRSHVHVERLRYGKYDCFRLH